MLGNAAAKRLTFGHRKKSLKHKVRELSRIANSDMGVKIIRDQHLNRKSVGVNAAVVQDVEWLNKTEVEAALTGLEYYDPSNPGTLLTASGITGAFSKDFYFTSVSCKLTIANNYTTPVKVKVYECRAKTDTAISPGNAWINGATDVGAPLPSSLQSYPSDSPQFRDLWAIVQKKTKYLQPGEAMVVTAKGVGNFHYDPSVSDNHDDEYQKSFHANVMMMHIQGPIAHDTVQAEVGFGAARVDYKRDYTYRIKYAAGADITRYSASTDAATFTTSAVCAQKPTNEIKAFSAT